MLAFVRYNFISFAWLQRALKLFEGTSSMANNPDMSNVVLENHKRITFIEQSNENLKSEMKNLSYLNTHEISYYSKYLDKTSSELLNVFDNQFLILKKVEDHAYHTRGLVGEVELRITDVTASSNQAKNGADTGRLHMSNLSTSVHSLAEVGELLTGFTKVLQGLTVQMKEIDNIVFTTKVLSLNATLESARVGAMGEGMSVVAREMTQLAAQIGKTSGDIQKTLKSSNENLSTMSSKITNLISDSTGLINSSQTSLSSIIDEIYILTGKISEMAGSLSNYKKSTKQLDEIVNDITKASNTLGTASANTKLVKFNLEELGNYNKQYHQL